MFCRKSIVLVLTAFAATASALQLEQQTSLGPDLAVDATLGAQLALELNLDVTLGLSKNVTVVLNGEPKSGTTWLEFVLRALVAEACAHKAGCKAVPNDRTVAAKTVSDLITFSLEGKHEIPNVGHVNKFDFSHAPTLSGPAVKAAAAKTLKEASEATKWLVIFRDPRDVTISSCYHMFKDCPSADNFMNKRLGVITAWIDLRYRLFKAMQDLAPQRVKLLFYEEMKKDEQGTIMELADLFGFHLDKAQAAQIHEQTTFSTMAQMPKRVVAQGGAASGKVREGAVCGYKKELSADVADSATKQMRRILNSELSGKWTC